MKYRKKPVVIEAIQFTGDPFPVMQWAKPEARFEVVGESIHIVTLEGVMRADKGDWIIRGVQGEYYPCKPDIFEATYERAAEDR